MRHKYRRSSDERDASNPSESIPICRSALTTETRIAFQLYAVDLYALHVSSSLAPELVSSSQMREQPCYGGGSHGYVQPRCTWGSDGLQAVGVR